jgi:hypothetical protein
VQSADLRIAHRIGVECAGHALIDELAAQQDAHRIISDPARGTQPFDDAAERFTGVRANLLVGSLAIDVFRIVRVRFDSFA